MPELFLFDYFYETRYNKDIILEMVYTYEEETAWINLRKPW